MTWSPDHSFVVGDPATDAADESTAAAAGVPA
jgi:hypothetical protein